MARTSKNNIPYPGLSVSQLLPLARLEPIFQFYFNVNAVIFTPDGKDSYVFLRRGLESSPVDFEHLYQAADTREAWNRVQVLKATKTGKIVNAAYAGMRGLFVPVSAHGKVIAVLHAGFFISSLPQRAEIEAAWTQITGRRPTDEDPHFLSYARAFLDTPWLESEVLRGLGRLLMLFGDLQFNQLSAVNFIEKVDKVVSENLVHQTPHLFWMKRAVLRYPFLVPAWIAQKPKAWEEEELGLKKLPTAILAVKARVAGRRDDPLGELIAQARLRRAAWSVSLGHDNVVSGAAGTEGALFAVPMSNPDDDARCWLEIRDWIRRLRKDLSKEGEESLCFGAAWADSMHPDLSDVYDHALRALMQALGSGKDEVVEGRVELGASSNEASMGELASLAYRFVQACGDNRSTERDLLLDEYLSAMVSRVPGRLEIQRDHLLRTLYDLARVVEQRSLVDPGQTGFLQANLEREMARGGTQEVLQSHFRNSVHNLVTLLSHPSRGDHLVRLEKARRLVDSRLQETLRLEEVAREAGFSRAAFIRGFRQHTGLSFLAYLQKRRVERASELLRHSSLSLNQISHECGFHSPSYFSQSFKRHTGKSPASYRSR